MADKLKPCPFCGSTKLKLVKKRIKYRGHEAYVASIRCNCCHARGGTVTNLAVPYAVKEDVEAIAIERWNTRKPMDKVVEQLEEAKNTRFVYNEVGNVCGITCEANMEINRAIKIVKGEMNHE